MKVLSLFAGIGGFDLGLEWAGMRTVAFCERDDFCRRVLAKHWPDVPCFDDVRTLKGEDVGSVDVICGGYPCQPFSTAGVQLGAADDRYLWPEFARLVAELRPAWVIGENVAGHITLGLDTVLADLEGLGYAARPFVIPAVGVGAAHKRDRVWIIGHAHRNGQSASAINAETSGLSGVADAADADCDDGKGVQSCRVDAKEWAVTRTGQARPLHAGDRGQRLTESPIRRADDGLPRGLDRARLKALGNAVHPEIPYRIGRAIMEAEGMA